MAKDLKAFLKTKRKNWGYRPVCERLKDYQEVASLPSEEHSQEQASRCMDCGTPFCHWACPVGNYIPEWNDYALAGKWKEAFELLEATNNFPEITGRVCPAPCEYSCVLGINDDPVAIRENELAIIEFGFKYGFIKPRPPKKRTNKTVAVIGSGPAGLSCAAQLNRAGHKVIVFERDKKIGGILRYGIPDFKLEKGIIDRRLKILEKEGLEFRPNINVSKDYPVDKILQDFDAVVVAIGSREPRDLNIEGRQLEGIYFAMDYLSQSNKRISKESISDNGIIDAKNKRVVVIGGGDTGSDCVGTANRQGASCVVQIEVMPKPTECRTESYPWPLYPLLLKTSSSHEEGAQRQWAILTKKFIGQDNKLKKLSCIQVEFVSDKNESCPVMKEIPNSEFEIEADLAILAVGFVHPEHKGLLKELKVDFDSRGNIKTDENYMTSHKGVFAAGDARRGQSLIVWAISEGRRTAYAVDTYLTGESILSVC
ncbi:MAG: glutamate synthase subunit beta [Candidatus Omnitrophica bacterium]|jgi:glutamate synthase (NADPH/NADH) small chain|nr:glutamate synthase subunit beta [Candidatus Omnitrophota bacterium]